MRRERGGCAITSPRSLTDREWEVAQLIKEYLTDAEVAEQLGISVHTVRFHTRSIRSKIGARTRLGIIPELRRRGYDI